LKGFQTIGSAAHGEGQRKMRHTEGQALASRRYNNSNFTDLKTAAQVTAVE
jgi:hypothetical protein